MKKIFNISMVSCFLIFNFLPVIAQNLRYGLEFSSFEVVQEKRTSLDLSPSKPFSFSNGFSLSFNVLFQSAAEYNFGYIFHIIGKNGRHIDFLVEPQKINIVGFDDKILAEYSLSETDNHFSSSLPFSIQLDIKSNLLNIAIGEKTFSPVVSSLKDFRNVNIVFGKCDYFHFQISDVPKVTIKDIRINDLKGDAIYYWKLSKHVENGVYDELKNHFAKVENPRWLSDDHAFWSKEIDFKTLKNPQIAYNPDEKTIAIADRRNFFIYNASAHRLIQHQNSSGFVHSGGANQMIYNSLENIYYSYCFYNTEPRDVATYNAENKSWSNTGIREFGYEYAHHNRFVSQKENSLYLFGGYGQHRYKNVINKYSFETGKWEKLQYADNSKPAITPRYLSGLGVIDENRMLLFGGYGSNSGSQSLSPRNYYDLYQVNLPDLSVTKLWEMQPPANHFVVANSMIVDTLNHCFYALCFPQSHYETSLSLVKFSLQKPEYQIVSNSIPFYFNDILSYADLFQNQENGELYAITYSSLPTDSLASVSIYKLAYPPVSEAYINQLIKNNNRTYFLAVGICVLLLISALIAYRFYRKKKMNAEMDSEQFSKLLDKELQEVKQVNGRKKERAIFLFGGFQMKDKSGNDITTEFSPMLKQLFLIILLYSFKESGKGVPVLKLEDALWPDKTHISARNNRSVMISKIRQVFENIGYINVESFNSHWVVKFGDEIYCDYCEALRIIREIKKKNRWTKEEIITLLNIVSSGEMLPNVQIDWVDTFKTGFTNELIDLLIGIGKQDESAFSSAELIYLADTLLIHDMLNDDALKLKCKALVKMGKNGLAKKTYDAFAKHYQILFGSNYNYTFDQIIS
jgi:two-component SAPR family response regulator